MKTTEEIAELIREHFNPDYAQTVHPDVQHLHNKAVEVAKHLDVEPSPLMINHIVGLIQQHVERPSAEYPKMLYHHASRTERVVENAREERDLGPEWVHYHWMAPKPEDDFSTEADRRQEPHQDGSEDSQSRH